MFDGTPWNVVRVSDCSATLRKAGTKERTIKVQTKWVKDPMGRKRKVLLEEPEYITVQAKETTTTNISSHAFVEVLEG